MAQENANLEDIVRFFEGYELMGNPVTMMKKVCISGGLPMSPALFVLPLIHCREIYAA